MTVYSFVAWKTRSDHRRPRRESLFYVSHHHQLFSVHNNCLRSFHWNLDVSFVLIIQCESKKSPPLKFFDIFPERLEIFSSNFTCLLYVPVYARLQIFIQLSATLTKLWHNKRDHHNVLKMSTIDWKRTLGGRT